MRKRGCDWPPKKFLGRQGEVVDGKEIERIESRARKPDQSTEKSECAREPGRNQRRCDMEPLHIQGAAKRRGKISALARSKLNTLGAVRCVEDDGHSAESFVYRNINCF
jgi:hypothetical protein